MSFFGPENPEPFAVISERYRRQLQIDKIQKEKSENENLAQLFNLGPEYNRNFCDAIRYYGEVDIDMRVAYVGPEKGSLAEEVAIQLDLVYPIENVMAGRTLFEDTSVNNRSIPVRQINLGADDYFDRAAIECKASGQTLYDRVIVRDAVEFLKDRDTFFTNVMSCVEQTSGKMLLFHRSSKLLTLPFYEEAKRKIAEQDTDFITLIDQLFKLNFNVEWEIVTIPAVISRIKWLSLLYYQFPVQLEITTPTDVYDGIRELSEGSLKYSSDNIEFIDRMILIIVSHSIVCAAPVQRLGGSDNSYIPTPQVYRIEVDSPYLELRYRQLMDKAPPYSGPSEWWGTVSKDQWIKVDSSKIPKARKNQLIKDEPFSRSETVTCNKNKPLTVAARTYR